MTARQIIESRLGRKLPATHDMPPDLRIAVRELGKQMVKAQTRRATPDETAASLRTMGPLFGELLK